MIQSKNRTMILFSATGVVLTLFIHVLHRVMPMNWGEAGYETYLPYLYLLTSVPIVLLGVGVWLYRRNREHPALPWLMSVLFTFISLAMIVNGEGMVVYHFSIFLVVALISFYDRIEIISIMTGIFAFVHIGAMFLGTDLLYGNASYTWFMFGLHAFYLVLTSVGTAYQITVKNKHVKELEKENKRQEEELEDMFQQMKEVAGMITSTASGIDRASLSSEEAYNHVDLLLEKRNKNAEHQMEKADLNAGHLAEIKTAIEEITLSMKAVANSADVMDHTTSKAKDSLREVTEAMKETDGSMEDMREIVHQLNMHSKEIGSITEEISSISESTNLLALNASIEAARAGEHGKGFSVVAQEVRKLSVQSEAATKRILGIVKAIESNVSATDESSARALQQVSNSRDRLDSVAESFEELSARSMDVKERTNGVSVSCQQLLVTAGVLTDTFDELFLFTKEAINQNKKVMEASGKQFTYLRDMRGRMDSLTNLTSRLEKAMNENEKRDETIYPAKTRHTA
ncbi:methyl-accepting chemotaxis protein [Salimicrobium flavidum]|uniref:Methyl-accepting chemotaxis protein n=1 Tax=Salimicrobium flavidum TaxID=570947 RepID=A0A1N7ISM7_9BACI|nr:methyl-accepting chemotaxis protein [Salimicrobium flavidum]SIS40037.1 methyl-accepting chemotaxis protein [Salimicrobium flavidum]